MTSAAHNADSPIPEGFPPGYEPRPASPSQRPAAGGLPELYSHPGADPQIAMLVPYKTPTVAWLLWLFLGGFGAHSFYLRQMPMGFLIASLSVVGALLLWMIIGIPMVFAATVLWVISATQIGKQLNAVNTSIAIHNQRVSQA